MVFDYTVILLQDSYACFGLWYIPSLDFMIKSLISVILNFLSLVYLCFERELYALDLFEHVPLIKCLEVLMGHAHVDMVSRLVSAAILDCFYMIKYLLLFLHWPSQIGLAQDLNLFSPQFDFILTLFHIKNFFQNVLKHLKINFIASSGTFLPENFWKILLFQG